MRFLTIFFMLVYGWRLFNKQQNFIKDYNKRFTNKTTEEIREIIKKGWKDGDADILMISLIVACSIIILIIQIFYVLFAFKYCNTLIWTLYVFIMIVNRLITKIKYGINKDKISRPIRYTVRKFLIHSINLAFFIYVFFVLFIL